MRIVSRLGLAFALLLAVLAVGTFLAVSWQWVAVASFADTQMRPVGAPQDYVPPPGPIYLENDSYYWLGYAQRIARGETWRVRDTKIDNFPTGREVHWSQSVSWCMVIFGRLRALFTGENLPLAIEKASVAINPLLFALAAIALFVALTPRLGALPVAVFLLFLGSAGDIGWMFQALRPGHQGFHLVWGGISVVGLIFGGMGLVSRQETKQASWPLFQPLHLVGVGEARVWFTIAGIATGLALWVSATIESFFIYPMMVAFALLVVLVPAGKVATEDLLVQPDLWRRWGLTAGITGFLFYLVEYFPYRMTMRIEVNHPVYDLAVVGAGEALRLLSSWRWGNQQHASRDVFTLTGWLALAVLPVLLITGGPILWHHMRDPQMLRMHNFITEFYTYGNFIKGHGLERFFQLYGIVPAVCLLTPLFLLRRDLTVAQVVWLWSTFVFACSFFIVGFLQVRWLGFFAAAACLNALVAAHFAFSLLPEDHLFRRLVAAALIVLLLLVQPAIYYGWQLRSLAGDLQGASIAQDIVTPILNKRVALALKASPEHPKSVIVEPGFAPSLGYFSGIPSLTSFYWENLNGLHEATRFFATKDAAEAHEIAIRTGATHVMVPEGDLLPNTFYFIANGHYDVADANNTFLAQLLAGKAPFWIQPDTVLNFITTNTYSYRGKPITTHLETFRIQEE